MKRITISVDDHTYNHLRKQADELETPAATLATEAVRCGLDTACSNLWRGRTYQYLLPKVATQRETKR